MSFLDDLSIRASIAAKRARDHVKDFFSKENGISNVVATIIILLIAVLLIAAFWTRLKEFVANIMDKIFGTEFDDSGLSGT